MSTFNSFAAPAIRYIQYRDVLHLVRKAFSKPNLQVVILDQIPYPSPSSLLSHNSKTNPFQMNSSTHSNQNLPSQRLTLYFRNSPAQEYQVRSWVSADTTLVVQARPENTHSGLFIHLRHEQLNTQLDLGGIAPAAILQFDADQQFTGASLSLGSGTGSFVLVTQSKQLLILPFDEQFPISQLTHFKLN